MNCQEAKQVFYKYLDQELSLPEEEALSAHLRVCRECREEYRLVLETHNLLQKTIVPVTPPADLTERIMTAYDLSVENNSKSLSDQPKGWLERLKDSVSQWAGSRQLMTAAVSLAVLMIFLFGTKFYTPDQKIAGVDAPGVDTKPTEQVDLGKQNDPPPVPGTEDVQAPENAGEKTGIEGPEDKTDPKPPEQPGAGENNPPKKSESIQGGKNIIQLPRAGSPQNGTDSVEVVPLVANLTGNVVDPVLTKDGSAVCYTMAANGKSQLWQVELKTGAEPQKVETEPEEGIISEKELPEWWPGEIPVDGAASVVSRWSHDGKQIAVNLGVSGEDDENSATGIWLAFADGSTPTQMTQVGGGSSIAWSPNGTKIAFTDKLGCLYVLFMREDVLIQVTNPEDAFSQVDELIWTPDNKKIILNAKKAGTDYKNVYMIALP